VVRRKAQRPGDGGRTDERAVYIISVAAELAGVHPQTLRIYERMGLLQPARTAGNTRRYSDIDVRRVQLIQRLTRGQGLNLAGVQMILAMEDELEQLRRRVEHLDRELLEAQARMAREADRLRKEAVGELVPLSTVRRLLLQVGWPEPDDRADSPATRRAPIPLGPIRDERHRAARRPAPRPDR
jgi:MerR family transcriptional regulator/heat shock protein HspR